MKRNPERRPRVGPLGITILTKLATATNQYQPYRSGRGSDSTARSEDPPGLTTEQIARSIYGDALDGDDWQEAQAKARSRISDAGWRLEAAGLVEVTDRDAYDFSASGDIRRLERWLFITGAGRDFIASAKPR